MEKNIYSCNLKFGNNMIWIPMYIGLLIVDIIMIILFIDESTTENLIISSCVILSTITFALLPNIIRLSVQIKEQNVEISVTPFYRKIISKSEIKKININQVSSFSDFLGIGYKYSKKYGYGFVVDDGPCMQIFEKSGKILNVSVDRDISDIIQCYL